MDDLYTIISSAFEAGQTILDGNQQRFSNVENKLQSYLTRAKNTLEQKQISIPKPAKRPMRTIQDENEEDEIESEPFKAAAGPEQPRVSSDKTLRPVRTAKVKANQNLKEVALNVKMRNDSDVFIKTERKSSIQSSSESIKENKEPENENAKHQKRKSPDEGIQSATESDACSEHGAAKKRSNSVEFITAKAVEIDITSGDDFDKMPPPAVPKKATKKTRTKQKKVVEESEESVAGSIRVTRSKIKEEKLSINMNSILLPETDSTLQSTSEINSTKPNETAVTKKGTKKKYPMPILVKMEKPEEVSKEPSVETNLESPPKENVNTTFNIAMGNETVTLVPAQALNETVTISQGDMHDSLMTEDNDEDSSEEVLLSSLKGKKLPLPPLPALKLKKNEVFNPYLSSPVKQKVQAFEKHAVQAIATPERYRSSKYNTLKAGTPSKIALYSKTMTPLSSVKNQKVLASSSTAPVFSTLPSSLKSSKTLRNMNSMSQESLEETKKLQLNNIMTQQLEEKRKLREEKQRQAQFVREALEKEKRDQAMKLQMERDEKHRKIMKDKEDKQRMEALKKKLLKEKQAKKYAEEKAKKDEFVIPKPVEPFINKDDSLHLKMQKQIISEKVVKQKKEESKKEYSFEMLHTDDSTDDESRMSVKRPTPPKWSQKKERKLLLTAQSYTNNCLLDLVFSSDPIQVDLRAIFPQIEAKKLIRNSSAVWRTPPKHYHTNV